MTKFPFFAKSKYKLKILIIFLCDFYEISELEREIWNIQDVLKANFPIFLTVILGKVFILSSSYQHLRTHLVFVCNYIKFRLASNTHFKNFAETEIKKFPTEAYIIIFPVNVAKQTFIAQIQCFFIHLLKIVQKQLGHLRS